MKYYRVTAHTMYCGEELIDYIATESEEELQQFKQALTEECAAEWEPCWVDYAEEGYDSEEDWQDAYYSDCGTTTEEISEEEFKQETKAHWPFKLVKEGPGWNEN